MLTLVAGIVVSASRYLKPTRHTSSPTSTTATACSPATRCVILGVKVGEIDTIEPQPQRAKITFWVDTKYRVPADVNAVILSPQAGHLARHPADTRLHRRTDAATTAP